MEGPPAKTEAKAERKAAKPPAKAKGGAVSGIPNHPETPGEKGNYSEGKGEGGGEVSKEVVLLYSSYGSGNVLVRKQTTWLRNLFLHHKKLKLKEVDGTKCVGVRKNLWEISKRRSYPQIFIQDGTNLDYVGDYAKIHDMVEHDQFWETFEVCRLQDDESPIKNVNSQKYTCVEDGIVGRHRLFLELKSVRLESYYTFLQDINVRDIKSLRSLAADPDEMKSTLGSRGVNPGAIAKLKGIVATVDRNRTAFRMVREAMSQKDDMKLANLFSLEDGKTFLDGIMTIVATEVVSADGISKAVKAMMTANRMKWAIRLLEYLLIPRSGLSMIGSHASPNIMQFGRNRNLINLLLLLAARESQQNLMHYLKSLTVSTHTHIFRKTERGESEKESGGVLEVFFVFGTKCT
ncbi:hypothetical protein AAMO2058_000873700 [Amorphochlora amoebiformis]